MAVTRGLFLAAVLLLVFSGLHCSSVLTGCPEPCTCQSDSLVNCSSSGLSLVPQRIQDSVTDLDLSLNLLDSVTLKQPHINLKNVWLGNNSITRLSLCIERYLGARTRNIHRLRPWSRRGCVSWAPTLQLLSVERNQLDQLPEGLEGSESLQVLQLSFNKISTLRPGDLSHLPQLIELHLQHNLITSLHPQMFQNLANLQVLDLSFNRLTSLHPVMYRSLRNVLADVRLGGNRWQCDCTMRSLRRWMIYDSSRGLQAWSVVCASPSIVSGRDLLQLEEDDLNCFSSDNRPELHQDVTVYRGSEILLSCSSQDSMWLTPGGQASVRQPQAGLVIADITERDAGLYVCVSEEHEVMSVFNLQISKVENARRKTRRFSRSSRQIIPQGTPNTSGEQKRNQKATQSDLALAVCLSVFITFLVAFILGVLARPCVDVLWGRVTKKKRSSETNPVSSVEQRQYDNEAYSNGEEPEVIHRERRATFSTVEMRETSNVQYYDTVAIGEQQSINNDVVIECEAAKAEKDTCTAGDSGSGNRLRQSSSEENQEDVRELSGVTDAGCRHNIKFEHIPDPVEPERRRSLSSCSDSSLSDKVCNEDQMTQRDHTKPKSAHLVEDSIQQRAESWTETEIEVQRISTDGSEIPGFSSEPFSDRSTQKKNLNLTDPDLWQDNEEQFEFSDSIQSMSARSSSVCGFLSISKLTVSSDSDKQKRDDMSSSSSFVSEDEPTEYTVNYDQEEEDIERNLSNAFLKQDADFQKQIHGVDSIMPSVGFNQIDYKYDTQSHAVRPKHSFSSHSSDSDGEDNIVKQETDKGEGKDKSIRVLSSSIVTGEWDTSKDKPMSRKKWRVLTLGVTSQGKSLDTGVSSPPAAYSSSSSSESEVEFKHLKVDRNTFRLNEGIKIDEQGSLSTNLDRQCIPQIKSHLNINAPLPSSNPSSSDESMDETTKRTKREEQGDVDLAELPVKVCQSASNNARKPQWPSLSLGHVTPIKTDLVIKGPSPPIDSSSSSDSDGETSNCMNSEQGQMHEARLPIKVSQPVNDDPQTRWSALDLEHTTRINRRLDIKPASPDSDSSSSSDSEDETTGHIEKQRSVKVDIEILETEVLQTKSHYPDKRWPVLDLEHTTHIKRRLDIKPQSPVSHLSPSSDSEEETTSQGQKQRPVEVGIAGLPFQESQREGHDPVKKWPVLDLEYTTRIKRRLDIKPASPDSDSSSSSDSEDETTGHVEKHRPVKVGVAGFPFQESQTESPEDRWPVLDLEHTTRIKRRLDIKPRSPVSHLSPSSDSEEETTSQGEKQRPVEVGIAGLPFQESQREGHDPVKKWPALNLEDTTRIKRRLDIKPSSPDSDSSSSSDSEDGTTNQIKKQEQRETYIPTKVSQTISHDSQTQWPALNLEDTTRIKRRLDIKPASPDSDSSSSSDSEDETTGHIEKHRPGKVDTDILETEVLQAKSHDPDNRWPVLDLEHTTHIKRRLDIKPASPDSDSSSSSESEDGTTNQIKKQEQRKTDMPRHPTKVSQTVSHEPQTQWPALNLEDTTRIKRRLDIKPASPDSDSSSSSDSEDETTGHIEKHRPVKVGVAGFPFQEFQTESPEERWPVLDLEHTTRIKRRLDIKPSSPDSDSSSSSDSEDGTTNQIKKQEQRETYIPTKVSQTISHEPQTQWPALNLEDTTRIKRRLDIKPVSPDSDSSSSSESEDGTTNQIKKQEQRETDMPRHPTKVSQTVNHEPQTQWPALNLEDTTRIKRRLDIKPASPDSDSSSSGDSEDETTGHIEKHRPGKVDTDILETEVLQAKSHDPDNRWPVLDLEHTTHIKRRLDIKPASPDSDSSSSSESEDGTTNQIKKQEQRETYIPTKVSQTISHEPQTQWPALNLEDTTRIKRRLDIKPVSPDSDSSSSGDSEDETTGHIEKHRPVKVGVAGFPFQESQTESPEERWPVLDLEHTTRLKRRLDIKPVSPDSDSSSSSESEDGTTNQIKKQEQRETYIPTKVSQTISHEPQTQWPALNLEDTTRIKRRLDIKPVSPDSDSSSSSDSEDETTHRTERERPGWMGNAQLPFQETQTVSHDPETWWPAVDLGHIRIKRRLDVKVASSPTAEGKRKEAIKINYHSSSSSDEEEESMEDLHIPPITVEPDPMSRWPKLGLSSAPHVGRRLDIRARSPSPESSSSSSESEGKTTGQTKKVERARTDVETTSHQLGTKLLDLNMSIPIIKRRMNVNAPKQPADSCSSNSDNESGFSSHTVKHEIDKGDVGIGKHEQQTKMSRDVLYINRRLDIKARQPDPTLSIVTPGSQSESHSSTSDSEDEIRRHAQLRLGASAIKATEKEFTRSPKTPVMHFYHSPKTDQNIKLEKYTAITDDMRDKTTRDNINTTPEINPDLESRWATMNLGISRFRKHLEITSLPHETPNLPSTPPPGSPFSSSSDKATASTGSRTWRKRRDTGMEGILQIKSSPTAENKPVNVSLSLKGKDSVEVEERLGKDYSLPKAEEKSNPDTMLTGFGIPHFRKYLDIKVSEKAPATPPLQQLHDSSSSSDNEDASTDSVGRGWSGRSQLSAVTNEEASQIQTSVYMSQSINIKLDQSQSQTEEEDRRAAVELKSQTTKVGVEPNLSRTYIPQIRRALDIRAPLQRETSSSSSSEDETNDHSVPDLSLGVPHVKRGLNIKAPLPGQSNSSSSSSENLNEVTEYTANQSTHESDKSRMTDDTPIAYYKRSIFQASLSQSDSFSHSGPTIDHTNKRHTGAEMATVANGSPSHSVGGRNASPPPVRVPSMSFDDVVKKRIVQSKRATDVDMPSEIRWTGIGHQQTDLSISWARRHLDVSLSPPQDPSAQTLDPTNYSRRESEYKVKQDGGRADGTLMHTHSSRSDSSVNRAPSRALDKFENSAGRTSEILRAAPEDRGSRKGLSALKAMSSERRTWDSQAEYLDKGASPLFVDHGPKVETSFNYPRSDDTEPLTPQPQLHLSSISVDDSRSTDQLYGIPRYRRHDVGRTEPPQQAPPPIPATTPPDESVMLTWRSPQRTEQGLEGSRSYLQQSRSVLDSDPSSDMSQNLAVYFDSPNINISHV